MPIKSSLKKSQHGNTAERWLLIWTLTLRHRSTGARACPARHSSRAPGPSVFSLKSCLGLNSLSAASGPAGLKKEAEAHPQSEPQCWCWNECCWATIHQKMSQWLKNDVIGSNQKHYCFKNYRWLLLTLILRLFSTEYTFLINFWLLKRLKESFFSWRLCWPWWESIRL